MINTLLHHDRLRDHQGELPFPYHPKRTRTSDVQIVNDLHNKSKANAALISSSLGGGPDEVRYRDLMVSGQGEADSEESVCSTTEGRRNQHSICLALVVNVVDDLKRQKYWFSWDDGEREIRLDGL